jgi:hypothetical protein
VHEPQLDVGNRPSPGSTEGEAPVCPPSPPDGCTEEQFMPGFLLPCNGVPAAYAGPPLLDACMAAGKPQAPAGCASLSACMPLPEGHGQPPAARKAPAPSLPGPSTPASIPAPQQPVPPVAPAVLQQTVGVPGAELLDLQPPSPVRLPTTPQLQRCLRRAGQMSCLLSVCARCTGWLALRLCWAWGRAVHCSHSHTETLFLVDFSERQPPFGP